MIPNKQKQKKKKQKPKKTLKEIRIRPGIADHDLQRLLNQAKKFLDKGLKVKVTCLVRGRGKYVSQDIAKAKMEKFVSLGRIMNPLRKMGSNWTVTIV